MVEFLCCVVFFFKQKTAYEMRISDWSSDVCSSDLLLKAGLVDKKKIKRASHDKSNEKKAERRTGTQTVDELRLAALETQQKNAERTRKLNDERRSEERRVGKAWVSTCRSRWSTYN